MRLVSGSAVLFAGFIALSLAACRHKAKRVAKAKIAPSASALVSNVPKPPASLSQRYFESKPLKLEELSALRGKARHALQSSLDKHSAANDSVVALAQALSDAPGSAVLAIELTKAARRAHDQNRLARYRQIAQRSVVAFPKLSNALDSDVRRGDSKATHAKLPDQIPSDARLATKLDGVVELKGVCSWLNQSFKLGRPPLDYVGEQGTDSVQCETLPPYVLTPELQAAAVLVSAKGNGERVFGWVAALYKGSVWLSPEVAESFAPAFHPDGNGFTIDLQRTEAFRAGLPELNAYVSERSTIVDVVLNEMVVTDRHRSVVMTFDAQPPQASASIVLHSRIARSIVDPGDAQLPKGYEHSKDLGSVTEEIFRLEWGDNQVRLTATSADTTKPRVQMLFNATNSAL